MLNIVFNDSAAGSMIQCSDEELEDVLFLNIKMDMGRLHCGARAESRYKEINSWFRNDPWLSDILFKERELRKNGKEVDLVKKAVRKGEAVRIWYDNMPESVCGLYYLISELYWENYYNNQQVSLVCLNDDPVLSMQGRGLGSLDPEEFPSLLCYEKKLSAKNQLIYCKKWGEVRHQQWPLRALVNGKITGVPADFYDGIIKSYIPEHGDIIPRILLGDILSNYAIPDYSLAEWRLSTILHGMKLKKRRLGPEIYDSRCTKLENYVFYRG